MFASGHGLFPKHSASMKHGDMVQWMKKIVMSLRLGLCRLIERVRARCAPVPENSPHCPKTRMVSAQFGGNSYTKDRSISFIFTCQNVPESQRRWLKYFVRSILA